MQQVPQTALQGLEVEKMTAMHLAAAFGYRDLVISLLRHGHQPDIDALTKAGYSPVCPIDPAL